MPNGPARRAVIDQMIEQVRHDAPWVWGFHPKAYALNHAWYGNANPNLMARNTLKYKTIDPVLRGRMQSEWNKPVVWPIVLMIAALFVSAIPAYRTYRKRQQASLK
jgi:hypothetical protein